MQTIQTNTKVSTKWQNIRLFNRFSYIQTTYTLLEHMHTPFFVKQAIFSRGQSPKVIDYRLANSTFYRLDAFPGAQPFGASEVIRHAGAI